MGMNRRLKRAAKQSNNGNDLYGSIMKKAGLINTAPRHAENAFINAYILLNNVSVEEATKVFSKINDLSNQELSKLISKSKPYKGELNISEPFVEINIDTELHNYVNEVIQVTLYEAFTRMTHGDNDYIMSNIFRKKNRERKNSSNNQNEKILADKANKLSNIQIDTLIGKFADIENTEESSPANTTNYKSDNSHIKSPHSVNGHWRNQPYGPRNNPKYKKIWIEEFDKGVA